MVISLSFNCDSGYMDSQPPMVFNGGNFAANFYPSNEWVSIDVDSVESRIGTSVCLMDTVCYTFGKSISFDLIFYGMNSGGEEKNASF